jgi:DNA-binding NarL/FixJ family response regulator
MIRILLVDRVKALNEVMASIFATEPDIAVIATAEVAADALPYLDACDVLLVTDRLPDNGALKLARTAVGRSSQAKVVVMDAPASQETELRYAQAGVAAYAFENDSLDELLNKMRAVHAERQAVGAAAQVEEAALETKGKPV